MKVITDTRCTEYASPGHPERPARIQRTVERLDSQTLVKIDWEKPANVTDLQLQRAHPLNHLTRIQEASSDFDADTAAHPNIGQHAKRSIGGALKALQFAKDGKPAFSLMRPPGHHATKERAMGFCYLNSISVSVLEALASDFERVAIFDFDVHHGNGTEAILKDHPGATFSSIHQHPCYPGTGTVDVGHNCFNYPVPPRFPRLEYRAVISKALAKLLNSSPQLIAVSAGFDAYAHDPLAQETLEEEDYLWIGQQLRKTGVPFYSILEGGYSDDLPDLILAYLQGITETP